MEYAIYIPVAGTCCTLCLLPTRAVRELPRAVIMGSLLSVASLRSERKEQQMGHRDLPAFRVALSHSTGQYPQL